MTTADIYVPGHLRYNGCSEDYFFMLTHISISNYTIVSALELEFDRGMTVITGETGAGKSIMLDALGLCLGDRADPKAVRPGCNRAEVIASFDIGGIPAASSWLDAHDLLTGQECILRRLVTPVACSYSRCVRAGTPLISASVSRLTGLLRLRPLWKLV